MAAMNMPSLDITVVVVHLTAALAVTTKARFN
jgi:hypothetical protein